MSQSLDKLADPEAVASAAECLTLKLANCHVLVSGIPAGWSGLMPEKYRYYAQPGPQNDTIQISVELSTSKLLYPSSEPHDLNESSSICFEKGRIGFRSDWCKGDIELGDKPRATLIIHRDARASFPAVLENILRMLMAYLALYLKGVLLHSAAITRGGCTAVLFGHSGAGKSTVSELALAAGCTIVSDDINILLPGENGWKVYPVPFSGTFRSPGEPPEPTTLVGLYRLQKSGRDRLKSCSGARAISLLSGSAAFVNCDPFRTEQLVDILSALNTSVPVKDLEFTQGPRFLQHVFTGDIN